MIVFDNVTLRYHYDEYDLLKGVSFSLTDGVNTILADTQSGKTSICKLLTKQISPTTGQILVDGQDLSCITNSNLDILYLPRNPVFFERRSVLYNIEYPLRVRKVAQQERNSRVNEVIERLGIDGLKRKLKQLDSHDRNLVALARGLTVRRKVVLFDDYFCEQNVNEIQQTVDLFDGACAVIVTSEQSLAQGNVVVLDGGNVVYQGDANEARKVVSELGWLTYSLANV